MKIHYYARRSAFIIPNDSPCALRLFPCLTPRASLLPPSPAARWRLASRVLAAIASMPPPRWLASLRSCLRRRRCTWHASWRSARDAWVTSSTSCNRCSCRPRRAPRRCQGRRAPAASVRRGCLPPSVGTRPQRASEHGHNPARPQALSKPHAPCRTRPGQRVRTPLTAPRSRSQGMPTMR